MNNLSPIEQKIKEAYNAGFVDAIRERNGEDLHHPSDDEYAHRKANELYIYDSEIDRAKRGRVESPEEEGGFQAGGEWARDRLFNKNEEE